MRHEYKSNIICPYCGWVDNDSWELDEDDGINECGSCEKEFNVSREIEISYSTSRIECDEGKHNYKVDDYHEHTKSFNGGEWVELKESEYYRIDVCEICDSKEFIPITKEEYDKAPHKLKH